MTSKTDSREYQKAVKVKWISKSGSIVLNTFENMSDVVFIHFKSDFVRTISRFMLALSKRFQFSKFIIERAIHLCRGWLFCIVFLLVDSEGITPRIHL